MVKNVTIDRDVKIKSSLNSIYVNLSYYARDNIPNYKTITEIPKENMDYINSVKYANNCNNMFDDCEKITTIDLSKFNTSEVTDMHSMFYHCNSLTTIDLSKFNTSEVTDMHGMFYHCTSLTTLDLSHFDTGKVTNMTGMFYDCKSLTTLDLSHFDTGKVTDMNSMFYNCKSLTTLDLSHFDTGKVTNMSSMFYNCKSLTTIKGTIDLSSCNDVFDMFYNTNNLKNVHFKNAPRRLLNTDGSLKGARGTLNQTYIIDNILENR